MAEAHSIYIFEIVAVTEVTCSTCHIPIIFWTELKKKFA